MKLTGGGVYRGLLDEVQSLTVKVGELADLDVLVEVLDDFHEFAGASGSKAIGRTPALYRKSRRTIFIQDAAFSQLHRQDQTAVVLHEVGHALRHAVGSDSLPQGSECIEADLLVCRWGFSVPIVEQRRRDYGDEYARRLAIAVTDGEEAGRAALGEWRMARLLG